VHLQLKSTFLVAAILIVASNRAFAEPVLGEAEEKIIRYESNEGLADPVNLLQKRLDNGAVSLKFEPGRGYLSSLIKELRLSKSSQGLVFSKTSTQRAHINPQTPRAVYFGDDVSLAWVPGGDVIDIAAIDPSRGPIFYTLAQVSNRPPRFVRGENCMECHLGPKTLSVPGLLVQSVHTASNGVPVAAVDGFVNGHNSPLRERWGGWYVTGTHSGEVHLGNMFSGDLENPELTGPQTGANVTDLRKRFDTSRYLTPDSDLVALLVLEHQVRMQNLITRANYETRYAVAEQGTNGLISAWSQRRISQAGELLLEYMLFRNEAPLKGPLKGTSDYAEEFVRNGPFDSKGRSLRQFDLQTRLMRFTCSYLIYSPSFDALPREIKSYLWRRLEEVLTGKDTSATYASMTAQDRSAVLEILLETKPEFQGWMRLARGN